MKKLITLMLAGTLISSLSACSVMRGNVVPQTGPTMEEVYDNMGEGNKVSNNTSSHSEIVDLKKIRQQIKANTIKGTPTEVLSDNVPANAVNQEFHKLANPELRLYIYPHLAGQDQIPVPGYYTILNVYTHDHYALPAE